MMMMGGMGSSSGSMDMMDMDMDMDMMNMGMDMMNNMGGSASGSIDMSMGMNFPMGYMDGMAGSYGVSGGQFPGVTVPYEISGHSPMPGMMAPYGSHGYGAAPGLADQSAAAGSKGLLGFGGLDFGSLLNGLFNLAIDIFAILLVIGLVVGAIVLIKKYVINGELLASKTKVTCGCGQTLAADWACCPKCGLAKTVAVRPSGAGLQTT